MATVDDALAVDGAAAAVAAVLAADADFTGFVVAVLRWLATKDAAGEMLLIDMIVTLPGSRRDLLPIAIGRGVEIFSAGFGPTLC